jgi:hypothetical protein
MAWSERMAVASLPKSRAGSAPDHGRKGAAPRARRTPTASDPKVRSGTMTLKILMDDRPPAGMPKGECSDMIKPGRGEKYRFTRGLVAI